MLYMKGGRLSKAVEMCFQAQLFEVLQHITDDMDARTSDPALYTRWAFVYVHACGCGGACACVCFAGVSIA